MSELKASPLAERTVVAVTGDHNFWLVPFSDDQLLQKWSVPFYLYTPAELNFQIDRQTFGSHMDIFPTLYPLTLSEAEFDAIGVDLRDPMAAHAAINDTKMIVSKNGGVRVSGSSQVTYYSWEASFEKLVPGEEKPELQSLATRYRALMSLMDFYFQMERKAEK